MGPTVLSVTHLYVTHGRGTGVALQMLGGAGNSFGEQHVSDLGGGANEECREHWLL